MNGLDFAVFLFQSVIVFFQNFQTGLGFSMWQLFIGLVAISSLVMIIKRLI